MKYLTPIEYTKFIYYTIGQFLDTERTFYYFLSQHKIFGESSPNFSIELGKIIEFAKTRREYIVKINQPKWTKQNGYDFEDIDLVTANGKVKLNDIFRGRLGASEYGALDTLEWEENSYEESLLSEENLEFLLEGYELFTEYLRNGKVPVNNIPKTEKISLKKQIIILHKLGFFDLKKIKDLNAGKKGEIVSLLLHSSYKRSYDFIRVIANEKAYKSELEGLNEILEKLGLEKL